ncbi:hypothetical protein PUR23_01225 [Methylorubrum populi]|uniref:hypothetical protein n=1 Tax=Methylorubrum populi TaxID=223967 RepID=UPI0031F7986F
MLASSAFPNFPVDCRGGPGIDVERVNTAIVISQSETILSTGGSGAAYTVTTPRGDFRFRHGVALTLKIDRINPDNPRLSIDDSPFSPLVDPAGNPLLSGILPAGYLQRVVYDATRGVWIADRLGGVSVAILDAVIRAWWLSLPTSPDGIGPNAPWRSGGSLAWTSEVNPAFTIDSPEGRRLTLRLIKDALPTSPVGLELGEPWLNGDTIAFVTNP